MTEEIKEIIDYLIDEECTRRIKCITIEESKQLLDYIKNLQQENEKLKYNARGQVNDYFKDKYADEVLKNAKLQQENERLKEDNLLIKSSNKLVSDNLHNYKSRCEKAIEFNQIVLNSDYVYSQDEIASKNLNILNGENND